MAHGFLRVPLMRGLQTGLRHRACVAGPAAASLRARGLAASAAAQEKLSHMEYSVTNWKGTEVGVIRFDAPDSKVNTLGAAFVSDFTQAMDALQKNAGLAGIVLASAKKDNFIAGADINQLAGCKSAAELEQLSRHGKTLLDRVQQSRVPVVAAINGKCLGGGLEVALACQHRVASSDAVLALPEVMLGLLPGAGGTQRLPRLVGLPSALDMMLTGKNIVAKKAKSMGLVHNVVDPKALEENAIRAAVDLRQGGAKPAQKSLMNRILELPFVRDKLVFDTARKTVLKKTRGNYPAPLAIIDCVQTGYSQGEAKGYEVESVKFGELGMTSESKALVSLFHAQTACKKNDYGKPARPAQSVAVIGAGLMGAGIAEVSAARGLQVLLCDRDNAGLARGFAQVSGNMQNKVKRKRMSSFEAETVMARLHGLSQQTPREQYDRQMGKVDLVIEAVFEDLSLKQKVLSDLEKVVPAHCVVASNTSQIPIGKIAAACARPERVLGMHYFSPVDKMQLLEIITTEKTSPEAAAIAVDAGLRQGKAVIVVGDGPGFYTTRILAPYMAEFFAMQEQGVRQPREFDQIMMDFGFPVGPATLADEVGLDVGLHVAEDLGKAFGDRMGDGTGQNLIHHMVNDLKCLGRKSKKGFYVYEEQKKGFFGFSKSKGRSMNEAVLGYVNKNKAQGEALSKEDIQYRMVLRFVNEAVLCLQEGIIKNPTDGDFGAVFGLGFPPNRGGPFRWVDSFGADNVVKLMEKYRSLGPQFAPCDLLLEHAKSGKKFHAK